MILKNYYSAIFLAPNFVNNLMFFSLNFRLKRINLHEFKYIDPFA